MKALLQGKKKYLVLKQIRLVHILIKELKTKTQNSPQKYVTDVIRHSVPKCKRVQRLKSKM